MKGLLCLTCTESEELGEMFQNHGRFHTVARELLLSFFPCSYLMWELLIYMTFKKCVYILTDMCMCVHVCAHAFGGQATASSGAPQALSILGLSLAWDLLIQPGWLAREPPGTPFSPVLQLLNRSIYHREGLLYVCSGLRSSCLHGKLSIN